MTAGTLTLKLRMILMALVAAFGLSVGLGSLAPQSAAAADPVKLRLTVGNIRMAYAEKQVNPYVVKPWQLPITTSTGGWLGYEHWVFVTNISPAPVSRISFEIYDERLPLDYNRIFFTIHRKQPDGSFKLFPGSGTNCRVTDGLAIAPKTRAVCDFDAHLNPGDFFLVKLRTSTTNIWGTGSDYLRIKASLTNDAGIKATEAQAVTSIRWEP